MVNNMDNNIDNKGYWENQTIAQNTNEVNNNELIELLKQEFDNINKTLFLIVIPLASKKSIIITLLHYTKKKSLYLD